jgi:hypothetical protein
MEEKPRGLDRSRTDLGARRYGKHAESVVGRSALRYS